LCLNVNRKPQADKKVRHKNERVIHTRVPAVLEEELKQFADHLRVPVSNLIRTILEDALAMANQAGGRVERELRSGLDRLTRGRHTLRSKLAGRIPRR
jgi:hypothetical protein